MSDKVPESISFLKYAEIRIFLANTYIVVLLAKHNGRNFG